MQGYSMKLNDKVNKLRTFFGTLNLDHNDERNQFLGSQSTILLWLNIQLDLYYQLARQTTSTIPQKILKDNPDLASSDLETQKIRIGEFLNNVDRLHRRTFLTLFMANLELLLERINEILPHPKEKDEGYKRLVKHVLKELEMSKIDNETYRILYFPYAVRNSLHANGTHMDENDNGKIDGIHFWFKKGELVNHSSWRCLYFFCDKILDVVKLIFEHKLVGKKYIQTYHPKPKKY